MSHMARGNGPADAYYVSIFRYSEIWDGPHSVARGGLAVGVARADTRRAAKEALLFEVARQGWTPSKGHIEVLPLGPGKGPNPMPGCNLGSLESLRALADQNAAVVRSVSDLRNAHTASPLH